MRKFLCQVEGVMTAQSKGVATTAENYHDVFWVQSGEAYFAYKNRCPHTGVSLNWQPHKFLNVDATYIQCSTHGALFEIETGKCIRGPCINQFLESVNVERTPQAIYLLLDDEV